MFYITTSRPYTNSVPHLGTLLDPLYADVYKRFYTRTGKHVFFSMGSDEHSFKIAHKAVEMNIDPKVFVDSQYTLFKSIFDSLSISYDEFMQSSDKKHHFVANLIWNRLMKRGYIYKKTYHGLYCEGCEDFYSSSQLTDDGHCPTHPHLTIQTVDEENYFFALTKVSSEIKDYISHVALNDNSFRKEMLHFVEKLQDISVSRDKSRLDIDWGITVNQDKAHIMYVWFEALITYVTPLVSDELYHAYHEGDEDVKVSIEAQIFADISENLPQDLQIIGSDNAKFHMVIWSGILLALDLPPIKAFLIHGMINDALGRKFAKSLGNGITYDELHSLMGTSGLRFALLHYCNSSGDTHFNLDTIIEQYNAILGNKIGNALLRITTLAESYFDGLLDWKELTDEDEVYIQTSCDARIEIDEAKVYEYLAQLKPELAFREVCEQCTRINVFLEKTEPWKYKKQLDNEEIALRMRKILSYCFTKFNACNDMLSIFLPESSELIHHQLHAEVITKAPVIFPKIER